MRATLLRTALCLAEWPYRTAVTWRNWRFDRRPATVFSSGIPTISVGNLTTGGTGKTPLVEWLARWFLQRGIRVTLISRGYAAVGGACNDEALELQQRLPELPHVQNPDRVAAARLARREFNTQVILLDDAFQHRRIARDLDIVLIDATNPFGYDHLLPRGTLREPLSALARADAIALSRSDCVDQRQRNSIRSRVDRWAPQVPWIELAHVPTTLLRRSGDRLPVDAFAGRSVAAFCGIGNPRGFQRTLAQCGYQLAGFRDYPDHHAYTQDDVASLTRWVRCLPNAEAVLCTHKDLVKLDLEHLGDRPLWAVGIRVELRRGQAEMQQRLIALINEIPLAAP